MKGVRFITSIFSLVVCVGLGGALKCLNCNNVGHPLLCKHVTTCFDDEKCSIDTVLTGDASRLYNLGCVHKDTCKVGTNIPVGSGPVFFSCHMCCDDHDLCNAQGCNSTGLPIARGPLCYNCAATPAGYNCPTIDYCEQHEVCYNDASVELLSQTMYTSGCRSKHHCAGNHFDPFTSFVGKRHGSFDDKNDRRSLPLCTDCCEGDLCNIQCKRSDACQDDKSCATLLTSFPSLCSNHDLAQRFCKRSCNLCPSSTADTCGDLKVNCLQINQTINVCTSKLKAYEYGCLKHCGYCVAKSSVAPALVITPPKISTVRPTTLPTTMSTTPIPTTLSTTPMLTTQTTTKPTSTSSTTTTPSTTPPTSTSTTTRPTTTSTTTSTTVTTTIPTTTTTPTPTTKKVTTFRPTTSTVSLRPVFVPHTTAPAAVSRSPITSTVSLRPVFVPHTTNPSPAVPVSRSYTNGSRVVRGPDWKGSNEDGHGEGTIVNTTISGVVTVKWDNGNMYTYNMGKGGLYELKVITSKTSLPTTVRTTTTTVPPTTTTQLTTTTTIKTTTMPKPSTPKTTTTSLKTTSATATTTTTAIPTNSVSQSTTTTTAPMVSSPPSITSKTYVSTLPTTTTTYPTTSTMSSTAFVPVTYKTSTPVVSITSATQSPTTTTTYSTTSTMSTTAFAPITYKTSTPVASITSATQPPTTSSTVQMTTTQKATSKTTTANTLTQSSTSTSASTTTAKQTTASSGSCSSSSDCLNSGSCNTTTHKCDCTPGFFNTHCDRQFKLGETVVRGPDWRWGNQDGNSTGTVILLNRPGWVRVHWAKTGFENSYRIGIDGKYDIVPYTNPFVPPSSTRSTGATVPSTIFVPFCGPALLNNLRVGSRVQKGCDWNWGNQDGNSYGTITAIDSTGGWVTVKWKAGNTNRYRMGAESSYDLIPAP